MEEREVCRVAVKSGGRNEDMVLTDNRVYQTVNRGLFGRADVSIPLTAIVGVRWGWRRHAILAWLACGLFLVTAFVALDTGRVDDVVVPGGAAFATIVFFLFVRPSGIEVHSAALRVGGQPKSREDGQAFIDALTDALAEGVEDDRANESLVPPAIT